MYLGSIGIDYTFTKSLTDFSDNRRRLRPATGSFVITASHYEDPPHAILPGMDSIDTSALGFVLFTPPSPSRTCPPRSASRPAS